MTHPIARTHAASGTHTGTLQNVHTPPAPRRLRIPGVFYTFSLKTPRKRIRPPVVAAFQKCPKREIAASLRSSQRHLRVPHVLASLGAMSTLAWTCSIQGGKDMLTRRKRPMNCSRVPCPRSRGHARATTGKTCLRSVSVSPGSYPMSLRAKRSNLSAAVLARLTRDHSMSTVSSRGMPSLLNRSARLF
jgi:hypothetical protein